MSIQQVNDICEWQGIEIHQYVKMICPKCRSKQLFMDVHKGKGECKVCGKTTHLDDLWVNLREEQIDKFRQFKGLSEENNGVGGNY